MGEVVEPIAKRMMVGDADSKPVLYIRILDLEGDRDLMSWHKIEDLVEYDEDIIDEGESEGDSEEELMNFRRRAPKTLTDMPPPFSQIDQPYGSTVVGLESFIFCVGGENDGDQNGEITNTRVYCLDTSDLSTGWRRYADMLVGRRRPQVVGIDGKLFVFGGLKDYSEPIGEEDKWAEVYDTQTHTWTPLNICYHSKSMYLLLNPKNDPFFNFGVSRAPDNEFEIVFASRDYEDDLLYIAYRYNVRTFAVRPDPASYHFPSYRLHDTIGPYSYTTGLHTILHQRGGSYLVDFWYGRVSHMDPSSGLVLHSPPFFKGLPYSDESSDIMSAVLRSDSLPAHSPHANRLHLIWFGYHTKARRLALFCRSITYSPQPHSSRPCLVPIRQSTKIYGAHMNCIIVDGLLLDSKMATEDCRRLVGSAP